MPPRRPRPPRPLDDRDLAAEVHYLHSLWRRGPPAPAPAPVPVTAAVPNQTRIARRRAEKRKRRRLGRGAADPEDTGPERAPAPSPPASPDASASSSSPEESTLPSPERPAAQEEAVSGRDPIPSLSARRKANKRKRRGPECDAAETQDAGAESPLAPSPLTAHDTWPDGPTSSSPSKPPPTPPSPGSLAHREALRAAEEFFANHSSDGDDEEEEVSETEGDEEEAAVFFTGLFERDAELRGHYERAWEEGQFPCMACAGRKVRKGKARRFRGCVGLVQHARAAKRCGRPGAHRALAAVVCRVLGWDIERLPSIVIDPRGTLGQALAARTQSDAREPKEDVETQVEGSNASGDQVANELVTSKESAGMKDVEEIGPLNCEDGPKNNMHGHEEDAVNTGVEEHLSNDFEKETIELDIGSKESSEKEDAVNTGVKEHLSNDGEKETIELDIDSKESSEKDNANKDDALSQDNNGVCHEHDIAIESTEKEVNATVSEPEHAKTADDIGDTAVTRLGNSPTEENIDENKRAC